ncbi:MAG: aminoacyl-tRNA hydrolase [Candidatus Rifleibacteriota bacterium]
MIIAGLGNPGPSYEKTRHNAGFWAIDAIAEKFRGNFSIKAHRSLICKLSFHNIPCILIKPQTYMNLSGEAISGLMIETECPPQNLLVITDDINLPIGRIRLRASGSDGGHNGLKSIISHIGKSFWRLRIGVGQPKVETHSEDQTTERDHLMLVEHVLGSISEKEEKIFRRICSEMPEIAALWLMGMGNKAMTKYNGMDFAADKSD